MARHRAQKQRVDEKLFNNFLDCQGIVVQLKHLQCIRLRKIPPIVVTLIELCNLLLPVLPSFYLIFTISFYSDRYTRINRQSSPLERKKEHFLTSFIVVMSNMYGNQTNTF